MYNQSNDDNADYDREGEGITIGGDSKKHTDGTVADDCHKEDISDATRLDRRLNSILLKDDTKTLLPTSFGRLSTLDVVARLMLKDDKPFLTVHRKHGIKQMKKASKHADVFFTSLRNVAQLYCSALTYPPHIEQFFEVYRPHPISRCECINPQRTAQDGRLEGEVAEDFRLAYRKEADWNSTRKKLDDWDRRPEANLTRLKQYVNALFEAYARIVTVRVDFYYHAAIIDPEAQYDVVDQAEEAHLKDVAAYCSGNDEEMTGNTLARVDIKEVMRDRDRLFANMRGKPSLFEHLAGHVWRIEYSRVGGYHLHCTFFFDGSKVQQHEWIAQQICDYWRDVITKGRGYAHNCNRNRYRDYVLGPTDYYDQDKRERLFNRLAYLAKEDQLVYAKPSVKCKLFSTGRMPQPKRTGGRPRKKK